MEVRFFVLSVEVSGNFERFDHGIQGQNFVKLLYKFSKIRAKHEQSLKKD